MEPKTARITILIDPVKKQALEKLCAEQDVTPSQVVRRLIRDYLAAYPQQCSAVPTTARPTVSEPFTAMIPPSMSPPVAGTRLFAASGQEWVVVRTTHAEEEPEIWLVHLIKAADALAGQRHLSLVMTGEEFAEFCRDEGIA